MKEKIYTIPINEAFEQNCECPLCFIEEKIEKEAVEYELGPAMMEPDHRETTNEKGFCRHHMEMMFANSNKLPLALVMDTHLSQMRKELSSFLPKGGGLFKKKEKKPTFSGKIESCAVCDKIDATMKRYIEVLIDMWKEDAEFRTWFENSKGFCIPHFEKLYKRTNNEKFLKALVDLEDRELERIQADIHKFTLMFDYRNAGAEWGTAKDAPIRTVEKLSGYIKKEEN